MKNIILIVGVLLSNYSFSQNYGALMGTWEKQTDNQIFRIELWNELGQYSDGSNKDIILGHFQIIEVDSNGNETVVINSDMPLNANDPNGMHLPPAIRGGVYNSSPPYYLFFFTDINGTVMDLIIRFVDNGTLLPSQINWKLRGIIVGELNVPINITLNRVP